MPGSRRYRPVYWGVIVPKLKKSAPVDRAGWHAYYVKLFCKHGRESSAHLALWYYLLILDEQYVYSDPRREPIHPLASNEGQLASATSPAVDHHGGVDFGLASVGS